MIAARPRSEAFVSLATSVTVFAPPSSTSKTRWRIAASNINGGPYPQANCWIRSGVGAVLGVVIGLFLDYLPGTTSGFTSPQSALLKTDVELTVHSTGLGDGPACRFPVKCTLLMVCSASVHV